MGRFKLDSMPKGPDSPRFSPGFTLMSYFSAERWEAVAAQHYSTHTVYARLAAEIRDLIHTRVNSFKWKFVKFEINPRS